MKVISTITFIDDSGHVDTAIIEEAYYDTALEMTERFLDTNDLETQRIVGINISLVPIIPLDPRNAT